MVELSRPVCTCGQGLRDITHSGMRTRWRARPHGDDRDGYENIALELRERFQSAWAGCLGGAIPEEDYWQTVREARFAEIQIVARHLLTPEELAAMACCPGEEFTPSPSKEDRAAVEGKVASVKFTAMKLPLN